MQLRIPTNPTTHTIHAWHAVSLSSARLEGEAAGLLLLLWSIVAFSLFRPSF